MIDNFDEDDERLLFLSNRNTSLLFVYLWVAIIIVLLLVLGLNSVEIGAIIREIIL